MDNYQSYESITSLAESMPDGKEKIALREKAINLADLSGNDESQFDARLAYLMDIGHDGGYSEKYFTVFPWLLAFAGNRGNDYHKMRVLWYYKWVITTLINYPVVSLKQIEDTLEDLRKRFLEYGSNEKVYHQYAADIFSDAGLFDKAQVHYKKWVRFKKYDMLDDCEACVINKHVSYHVKRNNLKAALSVAEPLLSKKISCKHVPKDTYSSLVPLLLKSPQQELCDELAIKLGKALSLMKYGGNFVNAHTLIIYHAKRGNLTKAIRLFEKYSEPAFTQKNIFGRLHFYVSIQYLLQQINKVEIKLKLSTHFPLHSPTDTYNVQQLLAWFNQQSDEMVAAFNKRNGNTFCTELKKELLST